MPALGRIQGATPFTPGLSWPRSRQQTCRAPLFRAGCWGTVLSPLLRGQPLRGRGLGGRRPTLELESQVGASLLAEGHCLFDLDFYACTARGS